MSFFAAWASRLRWTRKSSTSPSKGVEQLLAVVTNASDRRVPEVARACLAALGAQLRRLKALILEFHRGCGYCRTGLVSG
jgi:hypothetical protein